MIRNCVFIFLGLAQIALAVKFHAVAIAMAALAAKPPLGLYVSKGHADAYFGKPASQVKEDPWSKLMSAELVNTEHCAFLLVALGIATTTLGALGLRKRQPSSEPHTVQADVPESVPPSDLRSGLV